MKTIVEKNRMIAEFMGILYGLKLNQFDPPTWESKVRIHKYNDIEGTEGLHINHLKFHTSWEWLMPVVEKCAILNNEEGFEPFKDICDMSLHENHHTYIEVVRFIELYNEIQK